MNKLLQIKPLRYLLMYFGMIIISMLIFISWAKIVPDFLISVGFAFIPFGFIIGYCLWIYILLLGFEKLDIKYKNENNIKKSKNLLVATTSVSLILISNLFLNINDEGRVIFFIVNILMSIAFTYVAWETVINLTKKFKFYEKGKEANLWDYFVTGLTLSFFPFGLLILHSHLRLILNDHKILNDKN